MVLAQRLRPDLILCSIDISDLDGFTILHEVRADPRLRQTPFVFIVGDEEPGTVHRGRQLGANDHLFKPFTHAQMMATVCKYLPRLHARFLATAGD